MVDQRRIVIANSFSRERGGVIVVDDDDDEEEAEGVDVVVDFGVVKEDF